MILILFFLSSVVFEKKSVMIMRERVPSMSGHILPIHSANISFTRVSFDYFYDMLRDFDAVLLTVRRFCEKVCFNEFASAIASL